MPPSTPRSRAPLPAPPSAPPPPAAGPAPAPIVLLALASFSLLFLTLSVTPLTNNDIWLHVANGRWILSHHEVPLTDPYSFSAAGNRFYAHEWLAGIAFALVHAAAGVSGLILFKTALGAGALGLATWAARRGGAGWSATLGGAFLALVITNSRFLERPEMFSYLLTVIFFLVLRHEQRLAAEPPADSPPRRLVPGLGPSLVWWLVPLHWLWVQLHGYFITGLLLVGASLAASAIDLGRDRRAPGTRRAARRARLWSGMTACGVMLLLGLANPNGWESYALPFRLTGESVFMQTIFEWKPTFSTEAMLQSSMLLALCAWLALLAVVPLLPAAPSRAPGLFKGISIAGLVLLVATGTRLTGWGWDRSPLDLAAAVTGWTWPHGLTGWLPSTWAILAGMLAGLVAVAWKRPALAVVPVAVTALTVLFHTSETRAPWIIALTLVPALVLAQHRGILSTFETLAVLGFLYLALRQNRNIVNFALLTLPLLPPLLTRAAAALRPPPIPGRPGSRTGARAGLPLVGTALAFLVLAAATTAYGWPYTLTVVKRPGLGVGERVPVGAVEYIRASGLSGNAFNKYAYGAYLIHELFPETRVFMDSRNDVYGPRLFQTYLSVLADQGTAARVFDDYHFDLVITDYRFEYLPAQAGPLPGVDPGLFALLASRPEWVLVYFDDTSVVYVPDAPAHAALIARDGYRILTPVGYRIDRPSELSPADAERYDQETARALARAPGSVAARLLRADVLVALRREAEALDLVEGAVGRDPGLSFALVRAGQLAARLGRREDALRYYDRALRARPDWTPIREERRKLEEGSGG